MAKSGIKSKIPKWRKPAVDIPVQDLREFIARYGPDVAVLTTWSDSTKSYQFVTIGSDVFFADGAVRMRDLITKSLDVKNLGPATEDLRGDHPNVSLTQDQINFLLWTLGWMYAESGAFTQSGKTDWFRRHHDEVLRCFQAAIEQFSKQPV
jgi:hypothetical protein